MAPNKPRFLLLVLAFFLASLLILLLCMKSRHVVLDHPKDPAQDSSSQRSVPSVSDAALNQAQKDFPDVKKEELALAVKQGLDLKMIKEERVSNIFVELHVLAVALKQYRQMIGEYANGDNAGIARKLLGDNSKKMIFIMWSPKQISRSGQLLDPWGSAIEITMDSDNVVTIRSAGKDRSFRTTDDEVVRNP